MPKSFSFISHEAFIRSFCDAANEQQVKLVNN